MFEYKQHFEGVYSCNFPLQVFEFYEEFTLMNAMVSKMLESVHGDFHHTVSSPLPITMLGKYYPLFPNQDWSLTLNNALDLQNNSIKVFGTAKNLDVIVNMLISKFPILTVTNSSESLIDSELPSFPLKDHSSSCDFIYFER